MARVRRDNDPDTSETIENREPERDEPEAPKAPAAVVWLDLKSGGPFIGAQNQASPQADATGKHQLTTRKVVLVPGINRITVDEWHGINPPKRQEMLAANPSLQRTGLEDRLADGRLREVPKWSEIPKRQAAEIALRSSNADLLRECLETETRQDVQDALRKQLRLIGEAWTPMSADAARRAHGMT